MVSTEFHPPLLRRHCGIPRAVRRSIRRIVSQLIETYVKHLVGPASMVVGIT